MIYHLAIESEFHAQLTGTLYQPAALAADGFVHCALEASVLPVANDYFADAAEPLLLLRIDPERLRAETRHEAPAPIPGGGSAHLETAAVFPHVYGPIDRGAITGVGRLGRSDAGYAWPQTLLSLDAFLASSG